MIIVPPLLPANFCVCVAYVCLLHVCAGLCVHVCAGLCVGMCTGLCVGV